MKKWLVLLLMSISMCACMCAWAEERAALPQAVTDLCASVHPGYEIVRHDGWGNEIFGQFALILSKDGDNILCMAEREQGDSSYTLTIDNTNAVYDGDILPGVLIDTGGDSLWYTYQDTENESSVHYGSIKSDGCWGCVSTLSYQVRDDGILGMMSWVSDGILQYEETDEDQNENIRDRWTYAPIAISEAFAQSMELENFNINTFDPVPWDGLHPMLSNEAFVHSRMSGDHIPRDIAISTVHMATLFESGNGQHLLRIDDWDEPFYQTAALLCFEDDAVLDTYHAGAGKVFVSSGAMMYSVERADVGSWYLIGVDDSGVRMIGPDYAAPEGKTTMYRNDGFVYGASPWHILRGRDIELSSSYEKMIAQMDQSAYALVKNPNPEDRLHLRAKPDKDAYSYGKFYNRTPVLVLERGDTWTKVQIGCGGAAMTGYMMTKFLAFDEEEKAQLVCAFPQMQLREAYRTDGVRICAEPKASAVTERLFKQESTDFIIGVSGDEWYVVLRADGAVGYVLKSAFWTGNG